MVLDDKDNRVVELDDFGIRMNAFDGHIRDVSGTVNLNAKKKYRLLVQDRYRRGGARYQYVLVVRKAVPDFYPAVIHHQNPGPGGTTIRKGGASYLDLIIHNMGGFSGPVTVAAQGLPKGLHFAPTTINDTRGVLVFWADKDAPDFVGPIALVASASAATRTLTREVRAYTRVWNTANPASSRPTRDLVVAVAENRALRCGPDNGKSRGGSGEKSRGDTQVRASLAGVQGERDGDPAVAARSRENGTGHLCRGEERSDGHAGNASQHEAGGIHPRLHRAGPGPVRQGREGRKPSEYVGTGPHASVHPGGTPCNEAEVIYTTLFKIITDPRSCVGLPKLGNS